MKEDLRSDVELARENPVEAIIGTARDTLTVRRVFGDPIEKDGLIVIPAARVRGGGGGGGGAQGGGGFGVDAAPAGAFVIKDGKVSWEPVVDVNRGMTVGIVALIVLRSVLKALLKR